MTETHGMSIWWWTFLMLGAQCLIGLGGGLATCLYWAVSWTEMAGTMEYPDLAARCRHHARKNAAWGVVGLAVMGGGSSLLWYSSMRMFAL